MVAVLAVKSLDHAKTRLLTEAPAAGVPLTDAEAGWRTRLPGRRRDLVVAMLCDTVDSVRGAGVEHVVVVTPDDAVLTAAADAGAHGVRESADAPSLNGALMQGTHAARVLDPAAGTVLLVQADLPAARADSLREIVDAGARRGLAMVTDHAGDGTALLIRPAAAVEPIIDSFTHTRALVDVIYNPWPTPLADAVSASGGRVVGGLVMLLNQAYSQVEQFTGRVAPREAMAAALD